MNNLYRTLQKCNISQEKYDSKNNSLIVDNLLCSNLNERDLIHLNSIESISGNLVLDSTSISYISCFSHLKNVHTLVIKDMHNLISITGFNSLETIHSLIIENNKNLIEVYGFNKLFIKNPKINGVIKVIKNEVLKSVSFLRGLRIVDGSFYLHYNKLKNLEGLEDLTLINASFSLSSNELKDLKELKSLKKINGMLGIVNNKLNSLEGLEGLEFIKTTLWNKSLRTIALNGNQKLEDISALKNVSERNKNCIIYVDSTQNFRKKPNSNDVFSNNEITVFAQNTKKSISNKVVCDLISKNISQNRFTGINNEFALDSHWRKDLTYLDYATLRGRNGHGKQLERIDLVRWQDKIYNYHFLKQNNIASMPILMYSHRQNDDFFDKLKKLYQNGLKSFVVKATHLANSNGIYRVKDGKFITTDSWAKKNDIYGKDVDFDYLKDEIDKRWLEKQTEEDWSSMMVNPGVIVEELIDNIIELKFSIVFNEVVGFFIRQSGTPSFNGEGQTLNNKQDKLPFWWKDAKKLAIKVAELVKADNIRIDVTYHKDEPVINEITWNGSDNRYYSSSMAHKLNIGYENRLKMLGKKPIDVENDDYLEKLLNVKEYLTISNTTNIVGKFNVTECKFIIVDIDTQNPKFYWINCKKHIYHYSFYKNVLGNEINLNAFDKISYSNENRKNIVGTLVYYDKTIKYNGKELSYAINFWPSDSIEFDNILKTYEMIIQRAYFVKEKLFFHVASNIQQDVVSSKKECFEESGIVTLESEFLMKNIDYLPMNEGLSYGILRFSKETSNFSQKDIVVLHELPNHLSHVSGILTDLPQTQLSHINLLAKQNKIPNAYLKNASLKEELLSLKDEYVKFEVKPHGYNISKASIDEIEKYFKHNSPKEILIPHSNLNIKKIECIKNINNSNYSIYGTKSANLGELYNIFDEETLPYGFAIPFYFYDEFMKYNDFYKEVDFIIKEYEKHKDISAHVGLLKKFRNKIRKGNIPSWMENEFQDILKMYPKNTYLRFRSSTNNEDLENFSGAGLYDSYSYKNFDSLVSVTIKKVWASIWNYRAFEERRFHRVLHEKTMMAVSCHPRYKKEKANGVAVTKNILNTRKKGFYINVQTGESLVTNPDTHSIPEEIVVIEAENKTDYVLQYIRYSNMLEKNQKVLSEKHVYELIDALEKIHKHFTQIYHAQNNKGFAMEIEFKITEDNKLHIKQARPWVE